MHVRWLQTCEPENKISGTTCQVYSSSPSWTNLLIKVWDILITDSKRNRDVEWNVEINNLTCHCQSVCECHMLYRGLKRLCSKSWYAKRLQLIWKLHFISSTLFNKSLVCTLGGCLVCWQHVLVAISWGFCVNLINGMVRITSLNCEGSHVLNQKLTLWIMADATSSGGSGHSERSHKKTHHRTCAGSKARISDNDSSWDLPSPSSEERLIGKAKKKNKSFSGHACGRK